MSARPALAGAASTLVVVAVLGNPAAVDAARDSDQQALAATLVGFASWDVADAPGEVVGNVALRLGVLLVLVTLLCGIVGRSRSRGAAWLGGWGAVAVAAGIAGAAAYAYQVPVVLDGNSPAATYVDGLVQAVNGGAAFGLWTGWLVGALVALVTRPASVVVMTSDTPLTAAPALAPAATGDGSGAPGAAEPPPPWWAPTYAADAGVRPGPTAFPPSGLGKPVVAGAGEAMAPIPPAPAPTSHDMTTASGDPHPSDPDATRPVGLPADGVAPGAPAADPDPDATRVERRPEAPDDHTAEMPRRPDGT